MAREPRRLRNFVLVTLASLGGLAGVIAQPSPAEAGLLDKAKNGQCLNLSRGVLEGLTICTPD